MFQGSINVVWGVGLMTSMKMKKEEYDDDDDEEEEGLQAMDMCCHGFSSETVLRCSEPQTMFTAVL